MANARDAGTAGKYKKDYYNQVKQEVQAAFNESKQKKQRKKNVVSGSKNENVGATIQAAPEKKKAMKITSKQKLEKAMKNTASVIQPQQKTRFNATEEMKKRRAAAEAAGKGKWNAQEEMRKRREAAMAKKKKK